MLKKCVNTWIAFMNELLMLNKQYTLMISVELKEIVYLSLNHDTNIYFPFQTMHIG